MKVGEITIAVLKRAVSQAVIAFWVTLLFFGALGIVFAVVAYYLANGSFEGVIAGVLALAACIVAAGFGAVKRAIGRGLHGAIEEAELGKRLVGGILARIGTIKEKLTLPDAAARLEAAARETDPDVRGWIARAITRVGLRIVKSIVLQKFGEQARKLGSVDIPALEEGLGSRIDLEMLDRVEGMLNTATAIAFAIALAGLVPAVLFHFQ